MTQAYARPATALGGRTRRGRPLALFAPLTAAALSLSLIGCITSPTWESGATVELKRTKLEACPNGLLDDGEDGDAQIAKIGGRDGYWFTSTDPAGSTVTPKGKFAMEPGGPPGSKLAAHIHGKMASSGESIYVVLGFSLTSPKSPYDASRASGIRFWAKGPGKIRFKAPDVNTDPAGDRCSDCYNDFGVDIMLQPDWQRYTVPFERLAQQPGWGDRAPTVSKDKLFAIQWQYGTPGAEYDIWVDQIELVGCDQPKGGT